MRRKDVTYDDRKDPARPLVGVGAVLLTPDLEQVLLIQRAAAPSAGLWSIPGGLVETGETLKAACEREILEETGLEVQLDPQPVKVLERLLRDEQGVLRYHFLIVDFFAVLDQVHRPRCASDVRDARWVAADRIDLPSTAGLTDVIARARELARGDVPGSPLFMVLDTTTTETT